MAAHMPLLLFFCFGQGPLWLGLKVLAGDPTAIHCLGNANLNGAAGDLTLCKQLQSTATSLTTSRRKLSSHMLLQNCFRTVVWADHEAGTDWDDLSSVSDERALSALSFVKISLWSSLTTHLPLCMRMKLQEEYDLSSFPYHLLP
jgi:hypothetical protein